MYILYQNQLNCRMTWDVRATKTIHIYIYVCIYNKNKLFEHFEKLQITYKLYYVKVKFI